MPDDLTAFIHAAQAGDQCAFGVLMMHYRPLAKRIAQQILRTHEMAEDAVQEAMIKVYRALPGFTEGNFRSWLLRIVTNTCYDHLRRQKRRRALSLDEMMEGRCDGDSFSTDGFLSDGAGDLVDGVIRDETLTELMAAIDGLPGWHRSAVILIDVHGYDYEAAAVMAGVPLGTMKSRLNRARNALRKQLADHAAERVKR